MKQTIASNNSFERNCIIENGPADFFNACYARPLYGIYLLSGKTNIKIDTTAYPVEGKTAIFTTPWQTMQFKQAVVDGIRVLWFHGDYYCIEYHKKEVACNGLLFNNIYAVPYINLSDAAFLELHDLFSKLQQELNYSDTYSHMVSRSYLQLILALSSKIKIGQMPALEEVYIHHPIAKFKDLLDRHFISERGPAFYATQLGLSPNSFSKRCKAFFRKSPSDLIHDRVILEAKKLIHLTYKSMKEIAVGLNFEDVNYFSRYFKKHTGIAPTAFRESVGVSVVADPSI